jgi:hypothetical protein
MQAKREKLLASLMRNEKRIDLEIRAVTRSSKRLDKQQAAAVYTNGPSASPVESLVEAIATKPPPVAELNDPVPIGDLHKTPEGKAIAKSWDAIPVKRSRKKKPTSAEHKPRPAPLLPQPPARADGAEPKPNRKARRTPDDFRAEMEARK